MTKWWRPRRRSRGHAPPDTEFFALYLTSGVPGAEKMWRWDRPRRDAKVARRRAEAVKTASILGMEPVGFSDWPSRTLKSHLGEALDWINGTIGAHAIDALWVSAWEGGHQDHDVANFLAAHAADGKPVTEFAEYNRGGGRQQWQCFAAPNGGETVLRLRPKEAMEKRRLLAIYRSEGANLALVRCDVESARPLPAHDYSRPPHEGKLLPRDLPMGRPLDAASARRSRAERQCLSGAPVVSGRLARWRSALGQEAFDLAPAPHLNHRAARSGRRATTSRYRAKAASIMEPRRPSIVSPISTRRRFGQA